MNVNEITFGIEIECFVPAGTIQAGGYHHGLPIPGFPEGWNAQHDGSLHGARRGREGVEIVSPVLKGADGIKQVIDVVSRLNRMGARVNRCCGFHVHVGFAGTAPELRKLIHYVANSEKAIFASTGTKAREQGNYCKSIKTWENRLNFSGSIQNVGTAAMHRYHLLNISNLVMGGKPTVEFRAFAGTLNLAKILGHIQMALGFVQRAMTSSLTPTWNAKPTAAGNSCTRKGIGQTAVARAFYMLGWTKGRTAQTFGFIPVEGAPELKTIKKTLMTLARKYDAQ